MATLLTAVAGSLRFKEPFCSWFPFCCIPQNDDDIMNGVSKYGDCYSSFGGGDSSIENSIPYVESHATSLHGACCLKAKIANWKTRTLHTGDTQWSELTERWATVSSTGPIYWSSNRKCGKCEVSWYKFWMVYCNTPNKSLEMYCLTKWNKGQPGFTVIVPIQEVCYCLLPTYIPTHLSLIWNTVNKETFIWKINFTNLASWHFVSKNILQIVCHLGPSCTW